MTSHDDAPEIPEINFDTLRKQGNEHLGAGLGLGAVTATSLAILGATCPLCYVAVPALIVSGIRKRRKAARAAAEAEANALAPEPDGWTT
jgi:hypothetical protein